MDDTVFLQILVVVSLVDLMALLLGFLLWRHHRNAAEQDRQREARRHWLAARWPGRFPPSYRPPPR